MALKNMFSTMDKMTDLYAGNPKALQNKAKEAAKKQGMGKVAAPTLEALAYQKVLADKEAAMRDMQMQLDQSPKNLAQRLEEQAVGITQQELAEQVGDANNIRKARADKGLKALQNRAAKANTATGAEGLFGLAKKDKRLPQQRQPQQVNAAQGGLMRFDNGGTARTVSNVVTPEEVKAWKKRNPRSKFNDEKIKEAIIEERQRKSMMESGLSGAYQDKLLGRPITPAAVAPEAEAASTKVDVSEPTTDNIPEEPLAGLGGSKEFKPPVPFATPDGKPPRGGEIDPLEAELRSIDPGQDPVALEDPQKQSKDLMRELGLLTGEEGEEEYTLESDKAKKLREDAVSAAEKKLGRAEKATKQEGLEALAGKDFEKGGRFDPDRMLKQRAAVGLAQMGGDQLGFSKAVKAGAEYEKQQNKEMDDARKQQLGLAQKGMELDAEMGSRALSAGTAAQQAASMSQRDIIKLASEANAQERKDAMEQAKLVVDRSKVNVDKIKAIINIRAESKEQASKLMGDLQKTKSAIYKFEFENSPRLDAYEKAETEEEKQKILRLIQLDVASALISLGVTDFENKLNQQMQTGKFDTGANSAEVNDYVDLYGSPQLDLDLFG